MAIFTGIYTEVALNSELIVPPQKPDIECIIGHDIQVEITKAEVIDTNLSYPESPDPLNPQALKKVIITGIAKIIVKYSALEPTQRVHGAHFNVPFCELIEWPDGPAQGTPIEIVPVIEYEKLIRADKRRILKGILIRLDVYR